MFRKMSLFVVMGLFILGISERAGAMMCHKDSGGSQQSTQSHGEHKHSVAETNKENVSKESVNPVDITNSSSVEVADINRVNVGNKICPVSGEKVEQEGMEPATYEYEGKIYNFCCSACIEEFKKDPQKYIKKVEEELKAQKEKETTPKHHIHQETH